MLFRAHFPVIEIIVVLQAFSPICWKLEVHGFITLILAEMKSLLVEKYPPHPLQSPVHELKQYSRAFYCSNKQKPAWRLGDSHNNASN